MFFTGVAAFAFVFAVGRVFLVNGGSYKVSFSVESFFEDSGYMRMWCGFKLFMENVDSKLFFNGDYFNMFFSDAGFSGISFDFFFVVLYNSGETFRGVFGYCYSFLFRFYKVFYICDGDYD